MTMEDRASVQATSAGVFVRPVILATTLARMAVAVVLFGQRGTEMPDPVIQTRNARNRRKGKGWEYELRKGLRDTGHDVEALRQTGTKDEGDLVVRHGDNQFIVIEAKNARMEPAEFVRQAHLEATHFADNRGLNPGQVRGVAVVKRAGMNWRHAYVITTLENYLGMEPK